VREILVSKVDPEASFDSLPESSKEELAELVKRTHTDKILRLVEVLAETEDKMRWSSNKRLHLEMGLIKAVHTLAEASISDIIMALEGAPLATAAPASSSDPASQQEPSTFISSATAPTPAPGKTSSLLLLQQTTPSYGRTFDGSDSRFFCVLPCFISRSTENSEH
jgi:DNA polymerase III subunits gamma and tau domain III.